MSIFRHVCLTLVSSLLLLSACDSSPDGAEGESADLSGIILEDDGLADSLGKAKGISASEGEMKQQQARFLELSEKFQERTGKRLTGVSLSGEQAALLETMLAKEEDISLKGLLQQILNTKTEMDQLEEKISDLKGQLPTPDIVERGDSHMAMAVDYLSKNHGLDPQEAEKIARRSLLTNHIAPGMEVWHFYVDGVYGTTVTQGTARVSPYFLNVRTMRKLKDERDEALALAASLEAEITVLEATRDELQSDLRRLTSANQTLTRERDQLSDDKDQLVTEDESVYYYVDTKRSLREQDILAPVGMRLKDWRKDLFQDRLDLRYQTALKVYAEDFGVKKIRKVLLLPKSRFTEEDDYQIEYKDGGQVAVIHLDNISSFKNDAFVVVLK